MTGRPAPNTTYTSPMPTPRPHLGHALASEWTKLTSVRSTLWTLGSLVALVVGVGLLAIVQTRGADYMKTPYTGPALFGLMVGQVAVIVLGVLTICSEYSTGLIRTTFTAAPERTRVLTAKYLVFGAVSFAVIVGSVAVVGLSAALVHKASPDGSRWVSAWAGALGGCFYVTLLGVLALAVGALVRHSAGGIAVMLGVVTLPPVLGSILTAWPSTAGIGAAVLRYNAPLALVQFFGLQDEATIEGTTVPGNGAQLLLLLTVTGAAVAASYVVVRRRDV
ncbi:ABC transporter permease [Streptomyces sp. NPDC054904]|uniref:ABC transporter permease n=1 Tax=unclassified Streptomyces TaxID=2593676 RepID=UPI002481FCF5|nr:MULTISPECIES: ABC transporter permease [unclassified Streptomyces]MDA5285172.1 ABC transporter permease [Streptomyces sp. Isolate_45]MDX2392207.1 ABC transporter permease [Streptomyces sp. DK15]